MRRQGSQVSMRMAMGPSHPEKAMAPHSSTLSWKIPWTEEPGKKTQGQKQEALLTDCQTASPFTDEETEPIALFSTGAFIP